jgi:hypothetical protein
MWMPLKTAILRIGRDFGEGDVAGRLDEFSEFAVGDRRAIHPEAVDGHSKDRLRPSGRYANSADTASRIQYLLGAGEWHHPPWCRAVK